MCFAIGIAGCKDEVAVAVECDHFEAGFGFECLLVVDVGIKSGADDAENVNGDVHNGFGTRVVGCGGLNTIEHHVVANQAHKQSCVRFGDNHVLVFAKAFVFKGDAALLFKSFGLREGVARLIGDGLVSGVVAAVLVAAFTVITVLGVVACVAIATGATVAAI